MNRAFTNLCLCLCCHVCMCYFQSRSYFFRSIGWDQIATMTPARVNTGVPQKYNKVYVFFSFQVYCNDYY